MPWDWPVEVNYHEARAFCAWKGPDYRLPAEAEHNIVRGNQVMEHCRAYSLLVHESQD